ncbi:MAG: hypothetical protein ACI8WB_001378 [Phenylobacterium sp.]|jgi:hypothetical protein
MKKGFATKSSLFFMTLIVIVCVFAFSSWYDASKRDNPFAITNLPAQISDNPLLAVNSHISETPRPAETFSFPIPIGGVGPVDSLYSGPAQYPFYCMTRMSRLGQPEIDNQDNIGVPVFDALENGEFSDKIIGYSQDCLAKTRIDFFYIDAQGKHHPYNDTVAKDKIQMLTIDDKSVPYIIRLERGTINRFIYSITMLVGAEQHNLQSTKYWNNRVVFQFGGGSGIGFRQGRMNMKKVLKRRTEQIKAGYAILASTANKTSYTYNMLLAEDTAVRVKKQFVARYGQPAYTVGIGGSGGAIQQYLFAQNHPDLLDAIIPQYSYPDMLSQTIYALDCDLVEHYFAIRDADNEHWSDWQYRESVLGLNHLSDSDPNMVEQRLPEMAMLNQAIAGVMPQSPQGNSECINGWFGLASLINNPRMSYLKSYYDKDILKQVDWSYWQDMVTIYGQNKQGFARATWDNEGVQYGLRAFANNKLSEAEFIRLNQNVGSWKSQEKMQEEDFFFAFGRKFPIWLTMWSRHNITPIENSTEQMGAKRRAASVQAIEQAYRYGQVFIGKTDIPVIDMRHYLEDKLDMHHASASFSSRIRLQQKGNAQNQVIWMSHEDHDLTAQAFTTIDHWLANIRQQPQHSVAQNKPAAAADLCVDAKGDVIAQGDSVWDGKYNGKATGLCSKVYPIYATSRIQAGDSWAGSTFKCQRQSVAQAIKKGLYGQRDMGLLQPQLEQIFSDGVCDYEAGDVGRPTGI